MLPVFNEYIKFLNKNTDELQFLKEGYYWYDKSIIKAFDINGNLIKIARIYYSDELKINIKHYDSSDIKIESWQDTIKRYNEDLCEMEKKSLNLINKSIDKYKRNLVVLSSGGKDSSVTTYLVNKCHNNPKIIFNNTSLDCADTYLHIKKERNLTIINPKEGFYQWRKRLNFIPTRFARACCSIFKEGEMINYLNENDEYLFFMGMRNQESSKRSSYKDEWRNKAWGSRKWDAILPVREWTELQIWLYILKENININPKYKKGYSRVGCAIACPYYTKSTWVLDRYWYPKAYSRWQNILREDFRENNKDIIMNCTEEEYLTCWNGGSLRENPTEEVITRFSERTNLDIEVASNYFNHKCNDCGKRIKNRDVISMNMKFNGRNIKEMYCKKHLMTNLNLSKEEWDNLIENFKNQGCNLF